MSWTRSPLALRPFRNVLDRALESTNGIKINCVTRAEAVNLRSRLNYCRKVDRAENRETYPEDHVLHGASQYDILVLRIPPKGAEDDKTIYIKQASTVDLEITDL